MPKPWNETTRKRVEGKIARKCEAGETERERAESKEWGEAEGGRERRNE